MRMTLSPLVLALAAGLLLSACNRGADAPDTTGGGPNEAAADDVAAASDPAAAAPADPEAGLRDDLTDPMDAILAGDWRDPANMARDTWRHPRETLAFFGVGPSQRVVEISP